MIPVSTITAFCVLWIPLSLRKKNKETLYAIPSDDPVDEPADVTDNKTAEPKDASPAKETEPVKETAPVKETVPVKEAEPEKDASSSKDAAPAATAPSKQQPEEVRTEEPK